MCTNAHASTHTHIPTHSHAPTYTRTHTHTHTHPQRRTSPPYTPVMSSPPSAVASVRRPSSLAHGEPSEQVHSDYSTGSWITLQEVGLLYRKLFICQQTSAQTSDRILSMREHPETSSGSPLTERRDPAGYFPHSDTNHRKRTIWAVSVPEQRMRQSIPVSMVAKPLPSSHPSGQERSIRTACIR